MKKERSADSNRVLNPFIAKHQKDVIGVLHSFDRIRLQGSLRYLYCADVFKEYLSKAKVLFKDFKDFATGLTTEVCTDVVALARKALHLPEFFQPGEGGLCSGDYPA